jgi:hypothetical protein
MSWAGNLLLTIGSPLRLAINKSTAARPASPLGTATVVSVGVLIIGIAMSSNPTRLRGELSVLVARAEVEIVCICARAGCTPLLARKWCVPESMLWLKSRLLQR